jgi:DNA topoisomerase I
MEIARLSHHEFLAIDRNYQKAAKAAKLVYVSDSKPGIERHKKGKGFVYIYDHKPLKEKEELARIKKLAIPPAWTNVWICPSENGHIQATGFDARNRKQYRYHALWSTLRNETKYHHLYEFGKVLPAARLKVEEDIAKKSLCEEKVLATLVSLMERTFIRIGSNGYEKLYGSFGLTTLKDKHVTLNGSTVAFSFKGKKGIVHNITLKNKRLARIVQQCRDIPGKELFQYLDEDGNRHSIDSGSVNNYIKEITGSDFTAKDFRTWAGSLHILTAFKALGEAGSAAENKRNIVAALDEVSKKLGNTRSVCKKYYVHPGLLKLYEENSLLKQLKELDAIEEPDDRTGYTSGEKVLMKILGGLSK